MLDDFAACHAAIVIAMLITVSLLHVIAASIYLHLVLTTCHVFSVLNTTSLKNVNATHIYFTYYYKIHYT